MTEPKTFDLLNSPLEGTNLIEASAGTGKTYNLTGIFLRLVVEKRLAVNEILVVTFTEAATGELRDRIRSNLRNALEAFMTRGTDDIFLKNFLEKYRSVEHAPQLLKYAIRDFDEAAIFTIHSFCKRMLDEHAFESGVLFDTEFVTEQDSLKKEIVQDFWRKNVYSASPLFVNYVLKNGINPDKLLKLVGIRLIQPEINIIPQLDSPDSTKDEKEYLTAFDEIKNAWAAAKAEVTDILLNNKNLNRNKYRQESIAAWVSLMDIFAASNGMNPVLFDKFEKFTLTEITAATKKNCPVPAHLFFETCDSFKAAQQRLIEVFDQRLIALKVDLFNYVQHELARRKRDKNIQSFDDLLLNMYHALKSPGGNHLTESIRNKYRAALVDEFQDTDPVQYEIFKTIFSHPGKILFLIGDPKQAIYGFRGADIFAYIQAAKHAAARFTLDQNWRSEPGLITAINKIFLRAKAPFVFDEIPYPQVVAARKEDRDYLAFDHNQESPLQLWYLNADEFAPEGKAISKETAREVIYRTVAAEISRLLKLAREGRATIGDKPLREQHIAVLVRRNSEATTMQHVLRQLNIPAVLHSTTNLFDSPEAMEVQRLIMAIAEPNNDKLLKAALATDLLGMTGSEIERLAENDREWENWLAKFRSYHEMWNRRGFIQMFRSCISQQGILPRLMAFQDGERRNTNVLHLAEVLHQVALEKKLGMTGLLKCLSEQRDKGSPRMEEHQLRLESDENAVKLVTVHKSKGLEYPVVLCPFSWDGSKISRATEYLTFHDESHDLKLTIDLGSEQIEENRILAEKELLAENLRLLYVALTRAKHRCYLAWGKFNEAETSAPAYLLHQPKIASQDSLIQETSLRFKQMNDSEIMRELAELEHESSGTIKLSPVKTITGIPYSPDYSRDNELTFQPFDRAIDSSWRISSYSSLVSGISHGEEIADYDYDVASASLEITDGERKPSGIISFPGGARSGIFFHRIFELIDYEHPDDAVITDLLDEFGFEHHWHQPIGDMVQNVLSTRVEINGNKFALSGINNQNRINELGFYFPLKKIAPADLTVFFNKYATSNISAHFPEHVGRLNFAPMRGYMKGFIDLVFQFDDRFYIVDWKSNVLGSQIEDYGQDGLLAAMENHFYILQYYIYTLALHQYLKLRLPDYDYEKHFGGVFYVFLRGADARLGNEYGFFHDRPSAELIAGLSDILVLG